MEPYIILTSVSDGVNDLGAFVEVDTTSLHCIELTDLDLTKVRSVCISFRFRGISIMSMSRYTIPFDVYRELMVHL